jgi:hypothetical protein
MDLCCAEIGTFFQIIRSADAFFLYSAYNQSYS